MRGIVSDEILNRKDKIGFATPEDEWLVAKSDNIIKYIKQSEHIPFINKEELLKEFQEIFHAKKFLNSRVWRMFNYFYWFSLVSHKLAKF
jgi:asparagine synthase (glutamine-hydrolysing)